MNASKANTFDIVLLVARPAAGKSKSFVRPGELEAAQKEEARGAEGKTMSRRKFLKVAGAAALAALLPLLYPPTAIFARTILLDLPLTALIFW